MKKNYFLFLLSWIIIWHCTSIAQNENLPQRPEYQPYERQIYQGEIKKIEIILPNDSTIVWQDITKELNRLLDYQPVVIEPELVKKKEEGWRILIYRGRDRKAALAARQKSYEIFPKHRPYFVYKPPSYKVKVGDFVDASEYSPVFKRLKREFPEAVIVPDIINLVIINKEKPRKKEQNKEIEDKE
jgi:hypothetical protein